MSPLTCSMAISLFLCTAIVQAQYTHFDISGVFICPKNWLWRNLRLMEIDDNMNFNYDDAASKWVTSQSFAPHKFNIKATLYDDPGSEFEMELWIRHTCTDDGRILQYTHVLGDFAEAPWSNDITHTRHYTIDLLNKGSDKMREI
ncbi:unnamed protein product [Caenorhabditis brenneri]